MRDRIFHNVLFPAPFRPISPTTSPVRTSKLTSRRAQNVSALEWPLLRKSFSGDWIPRRLRHAASHTDGAAREIVNLANVPNLNNWFHSDEIGKTFFGAFESENPDQKQQTNHGGGYRQQRPIEWATTVQHGTKAFDNSGHGIQRQNPATVPSTCWSSKIIAAGLRWRFRDGQ